MADSETPMMDELEKGPWPSFVTGLKRLAKDNDMMVDLMGQLETSYQTKLGYWKGGTVGVFGYGGGVKCLTFYPDRALPRWGKHSTPFG